MQRQRQGQRRPICIARPGRVVARGVFGSATFRLFFGTIYVASPQGRPLELRISGVGEGVIYSADAVIKQIIIMIVEPKIK